MPNEFFVSAGMKKGCQMVNFRTKKSQFREEIFEMIFFSLSIVQKCSFIEAWY
jgi:hypothetical protein